MFFCWKEDVSIHQVYFVTHLITEFIKITPSWPANKIHIRQRSVLMSYFSKILKTHYSYISNQIKQFCPIDFTVHKSW